MTKKNNAQHNTEANKIEIIELGMCSFSTAMFKAHTLIKDNKSFKIKFACKKDEFIHTLDHECWSPEVKLDENGIKWKRIS